VIGSFRASLTACRLESLDCLTARSESRRTSRRFAIESLFAAATLSCLVVPT
jgi:hypothetical protein